MKKLVLSLLFMTISLITFASEYDKTISMTVTVGIPFTLNPYVDLGITDNPYRQGTYTLSDESAFTISSQYFKYNNYSDAHYYVYTLCATKTGTYIFADTYSGTWGYYGSQATMTYYINVVDVTNIDLGGNTLTLYLGDNYTFSPSIQHPEASTTLTWKSSNTSVATISDSGKLTTKGIGTTTITCTATNGVSAQCEVTVNPIQVTSITLNKSDAELSVGDQLQLSATITPNNASDNSVTWSSTNEAVAVVNESGKVYAVGTGFSQIKAKANDGSNKTASCMVTVKDKTVLKGDVNGDGKVTVTDAEEVIDIILNNN